jgi:hypothetical protein
MQTFNEFKSDAERQEIATLICDLGIDPDTFFEQALNEGVFKDGFKKAGDWWKKNFTAPDVVRLQSTHEKALKALSNFETNFANLRKQGHTDPNVGYQLGAAISNIKKNLEGMSKQVASVDAHANQGVQDTPYKDIQSWDGGPGIGQKAVAAGQAIGQQAGQAQQVVQDYQQRRADKRAARQRANDRFTGPMDRWQQQQQ